MALQISQSEVDGITLVKIEGRLVLGPEAASLQDEIPRLTEQSKTRVLFDLKEVPYIDSTGLGILVLGNLTFAKAGGALKLLNVSERHMELFVLTKLASIFEMYDDEQAAIDSFYPERNIKRFDILEFVKSQENENTDLKGDEQDDAQQGPSGAPMPEFKPEY